MACEVEYSTDRLLISMADADINIKAKGTYKSSADLKSLPANTSVKNDTSNSINGTAKKP